MQISIKDFCIIGIMGETQFIKTNYNNHSDNVKWDRCKGPEMFSLETALQSEDMFTAKDSKWNVTHQST